MAAALDIDNLCLRIDAALSSGSGGGTLLHGPAGCGKTRLAHSLATRLKNKWPVRFLDTSKVIMQHNSGGGGSSSSARTAESALQQQVLAVRAAAPCVFVIDEIHGFVPRDAEPGSVEARLALQLADAVQAMRSAAVFTLAVCREPATVHDALRRSGRLHHTLELRVPSPSERADLLETMADRLLPPRRSADEEEDGPHDKARESMRQVVRAAGGAAHGLCAAQLGGLCQHAASAAWRRGRRLGDDEASSDAVVIPSAEEWWAALEATRSTALSALGLPTAHVPSALPAAADETDSTDAAAAKVITRVDDPSVDASAAGAGAGDTTTTPPPPPAAVVAALEALRLMPSGDTLLHSLLSPLQSPEAFMRMGVPPPRGLLLFGPPGCGKTTLARHVATAANANFVEVPAATLVSPVVGASERALARLFAAARAAAPCVLFIDGLEALAPPRGADSTTEGTFDRLLSLLLTEMDGALSSSSRGGRTPNQPSVVLLGATRDPSLLDPAILRPGRLDVHLSALCREAAMCALRESLDAPAVQRHHFEAAALAVAIVGA